MITKICINCKQEKTLSEFGKDNSHKDSLSYYCFSCSRLLSKINRDKYPWKVVYKAIKQRCENKNRKDYKSYGAKGVKALLTVDEIKFLWLRDNAFEMKQPSIDRLNDNGNYELSNCQIIEQEKNFQKVVNKSKKSVIQLDLNNSFINEFDSIAEANRKTNVVASGISACCSNKYKHAGGFIWKFK